MSSYNNPVKIIKTNNWLFELNKQIKHLNMANAVIITSSGNQKRLLLNREFNSKNIFTSFKSNPTFGDCKKAIDFCEGKNFDSVIAIGGGSAMDLAKVIIAYLCIGEKNILKLIKYKKNFPKLIYSIFLPTTHGTASEVTKWGTIWDEDEKKKYSISNNSLYPNIAILDGKLTLTLPLDISIATTMDALSHSFEAIWNNNANKKSTNYAIDSICIILTNIESLKENPKDLNTRNILLYAATLAGLAFSNTKTAAAHSISYPLTSYFGIPHGVASSISLLPLLDINGDSIKSEIDKICNKSQIPLNELKNTIKSIPKNIISYRLRDWGVQNNDISNLVDQSFTKGRMDNNIVKLDRESVKNILELIY